MKSFREFLMEDAQSDLKLLQSQWEDLGMTRVFFSKGKNGVEVSGINFPPSMKNEGSDEKEMQRLVDIADKHHLRIIVTPDKKNQNAFYKKFGFVDNKGSNKDFTFQNTMYRDPE